ncbi:Uncharacterised protein [uncultured archaeon]|nr:Uncharacterised protein [uncultured archaeon]
MAETVKINEELLTRVRSVIKKEKIRYRSARQFVDIAVLDLLEKEENQVKKIKSVL